MMKYSFFLLWLWIFNLNTSHAETVACRIDFEIRGLENKKITFGYEFGEKQIILDTIYLNQHAQGFFQSKNRLKPGIYVITFPNNKYLELLIDSEQFFTVSSDTSDLFGHLIIEGSESTELFYQYQVIKKKNSESSTRLKDNKNSGLALLKAFKDSIYRIMPGSFLAVYMKMDENPYQNRIADSSRQISKDDFKKIYLKQKQAYFDHIPFQDERILYTRLLFEKLHFYFNVYISQQADTIIKEIDRVLKLANVNEKAYRYVLNFLFDNYKAVKNNDEARIFVYIANNYYLNGHAPWANKQFLKLLNEKVSDLQSTLIGSSATDLTLLTPDGKEQKLFDIKSKYLLLFFWSPDCNQCVKELPLLNEFSKKYSSQLTVVAIYTHSDRAVWDRFLKENKNNWVHLYDPLRKSNFVKIYKVNTTPVFYLLDEQKIIRAKSNRLQDIASVLNKVL